MTSSLLLLAYPSGNKVLTSFRWATDYAPPAVYTGDAKLTQVSSTVNSTHYSVLFRCQNCLSWSQGGETGAAPTSVGFLVLGWAHSNTAPSNGACADTARVGIHSSQGMFGAEVTEDMEKPLYSEWAAKATDSSGSGICGTLPVVTTSAVMLPSPTSVPVTPVGCGRRRRALPR